MQWSFYEPGHSHDKELIMKTLRILVGVLLTLSIVNSISAQEVRAAMCYDIGALIDPNDPNAYEGVDLAVDPNGIVSYLVNGPNGASVVVLNPFVDSNDPNDPFIDVNDPNGPLLNIIHLAGGGTAYGISPNGLWVCGATAPADGIGLLWDINDPNSPVELLLGPSALPDAGTAAFGVSNDGIATGNSGFLAATWTADGNVTELPLLNGSFASGTGTAGAGDISADGSVVVGSGSTPGWTAQAATVWYEGNPIEMDHGAIFYSGAYGVSPDANYITGLMDNFVTSYLALWDGSGNLIACVDQFDDDLNSPFSGGGWDVSNTGVVVGSEGTDSDAVIFKPEWYGVKSLQTYALLEYGLDIGTSFSAEGVVSDPNLGFDFIASFGSAHLLILEDDIPDPEPEPDPNTEPTDPNDLSVLWKE